MTEEALLSLNFIGTDMGGGNRWFYMKQIGATTLISTIGDSDTLSWGVWVGIHMDVAKYTENVTELTQLITLLDGFELRDFINPYTNSDEPTMEEEVGEDILDEELFELPPPQLKRNYSFKLGR